MRLQQRPPSTRWIVWVALVWLVVGSFGAVEAAGVDMMLWVNSWPQAGIDAIQRAADLFAERHPEVNSVTVQPVSQSELLERLAVAVAGGSPPDAIALAAPWPNRLSEACSCRSTVSSSRARWSTGPTTRPLCWSR